MNAIELLRGALQGTEHFTSTLVKDLRDRPLLQPTINGGNHALWLLGHLALTEGSIPQILFGEPNPVAHWAPLFAPGTQPKLDASAYPSFDELLSAFQDLRRKNIKLLDRLTEKDLDRRPANVPPGFEDIMQTIGQTLLVISLHTMFHRGQMADVRRAAGLPPTR